MMHAVLMHLASFRTACEYVETDLFTQATIDFMSGPGLDVPRKKQGETIRIGALVSELDMGSGTKYLMVGHSCLGLLNQCGPFCQSLYITRSVILASRLVHMSAAFSSLEMWNKSSSSDTFSPILSLQA